MNSAPLSLLFSTYLVAMQPPLALDWDSALAEALVPGAIKALQDPNYPDRARIVRILGGIGPRAKAAIPILVGMLQNEPDLRDTAAEALGKIGAAAVPSLLKMIEDRDKGVQIAAISALSWAHADAKPAVPMLVKIMKAGDVKVRSAVVDTLGSIPGPEAVRALADQLVAERDFAVRRRAVNGLWLTDDPRLEAPVDITRLPGRRRLTAAEAKVAVPALIRVLRELNDLRKGPVKIVDSERHALRWPSEMDLDYRVSCVLNEIGEPAVPALAELLKDPDKDLRGSALQVLTFMNPEAKTAVLAILSCLDDKEPDIRAGVAYALSRQDRGAPETLPILRRLLRDSSAKVRITAATSILWLGPSDEAIFVLLEELRDPQSDAGRQAAASLEGLKSDEKRLVVVPTIGLLGSPLAPAPLLGASMLFPGGRREVSGTIPLPK